MDRPYSWLWSFEFWNGVSWEHMTSHATGLIMLYQKHTFSNITTKWWQQSFVKDKRILLHPGNPSQTNADASRHPCSFLKWISCKIQWQESLNCNSCVITYIPEDLLLLKIYMYIDKVHHHFRKRVRVIIVNGSSVQLAMKFWVLKWCLMRTHDKSCHWTHHAISKAHVF